MSCDDFQTRWLAGEAADDAHAVTCATCSAFIADAKLLLADAAMPELSAGERAGLQPMSVKALRAWRTSQQRRSWFKQGVGLAVAASIGAICASAALLPKMSSRAEAPRAASVEEWSLSDFATADSSMQADDELDYEVSWPTTEGEAP